MGDVLLVDRMTCHFRGLWNPLLFSPGNSIADEMSTAKAGKGLFWEMSALCRHIVELLM